MTDIRVERIGGSLMIYDRLGSGHIQLTEDEAEYVKDRLGSILDG